MFNNLKQQKKKHWASKKIFEEFGVENLNRWKRLDRHTLQSSSKDSNHD